MQNVDKEDIIAQCKLLANTESDAQKKSDNGALALMFSEKTGCKAIWQEQLKEWNMEESVVLKEWTKEAEQRGIAKGEQIGTTKGERKGIVELV